MNFTLNDYHRNVPDEELLKDVLRVAHELGKDTLSQTEYLNNGGKYHSSTISKRFGGWINTLKKCNLSPCSAQINNHGLSNDRLLSDVQRVSLI